MDIGLILSVIPLDTILAVSLSIYLIVKDNITDAFFPEWKYTRKKYIWAIIWPICIYFNIGIMCIGFAVENTEFNRRLLILFSTIVYYLVLGIIYLIVKHNIRHYYDKKTEQRREKQIEKMRQEELQEKKESVSTDTPVSVDITNTEGTVDCESTDDTTNTINNEK